MKPQLAIFDVEADLCHVAHDFRMAGELLADPCTDTSAESAERAEDGEESAERKVSYGSVTVEFNKGRFVLGCAGSRNGRRKGG